MSYKSVREILNAVFDSSDDSLKTIYKTDGEVLNMVLDESGDPALKVSVGNLDTSSELLEKIKTVDGGGSGLDADKLDGQELTEVLSAAKSAWEAKGLGGASTDNAIVRFDGITGAVQNSSATIDDSGKLVNNGVVSAVCQSSESFGSAEVLSDDGSRVLQFLQFGTLRAGSTAGLPNANLAVINTTSYDGINYPSALLISTANTSPIVFGINDTEHMRITSSGAVSVKRTDGSILAPIVERGSNANGEYVKFADGTLICTNSNSAIVTDPVSFVGTPASIDSNKLKVGRWY